MLSNKQPNNMTYEYICGKCHTHYYSSTDFLNLTERARSCECGYTPLEYTADQLTKLPDSVILKYLIALEKIEKVNK